jgi:hypothetical protein
MNELAFCYFIDHRCRNHGGWCPPTFSNNYIARLNFIHTDHTALAYRSVEPPFTKRSSYASEDDVFQGTDCSLNVSLVNHFLRNSVTVTLQWPREAGAVYHVSVSPEIPHTLLTNATTVTINITTSCNIQYNVSIVSSLCGVTTTRVLSYGKHKNTIGFIHH